MEESFATAHDGLRLFVRVVGDGPQTVIVPAAAWLEGHFDALLSPDRRFVFYDTQARGRSDAGSALLRLWSTATKTVPSPSANVSAAR